MHQFLNGMMHNAFLMETFGPVNKISFNKLIDLFTQRSAHLYILNKEFGKGYAQVYDLEKGLKVRFWNFCPLKEIEIYNEVDCKERNTYFTLAFFLNTNGLIFLDSHTVPNDTVFWDTVFISNTCDYRLQMAPISRGHCLSISFSKRWLDTAVLENNETFKNLKEKICTIETFPLYDAMFNADKEEIGKLMDETWKQPLGSFYIKSYVLKIICTFLYRIKDLEVFTSTKQSVEKSIVDVERFLLGHITGPLPNFKKLAATFSLSESTLLRHFKTKFGTNMYTYLIDKRMEYANTLLEKHISTNEVAATLGYKNSSSFKRIFRKYAKMKRFHHNRNIKN